MGIGELGEVSERKIEIASREMEKQKEELAEPLSNSSDTQSICVTRGVPRS